VIVRALGWTAGKGRIFLVLGLIGGLALPGLAEVLKAWLPHLVALLLFLAALRIGPRQAAGSLDEAPRTLGVALAYQLVLPLAVIGLALLIGSPISPLVLALVLMTAAPSVSGRLFHALSPASERMFAYVCNQHVVLAERAWLFNKLQAWPGVPVGETQGQADPVSQFAAVVTHSSTTSPPNWTRPSASTSRPTTPTPRTRSRWPASVVLVGDQ